MKSLSPHLIVLCCLIQPLVPGFAEPPLDPFGQGAPTNTQSQNAEDDEDYIKGVFTGKLSKERWPPGISAPTTFNHHYTSPYKVWQVPGGYMASFNAGEFGGALFYADQKATQWRRVIDGYFDQFVPFGSDVYLAVGGLRHLGHTSGSAFLIRREPSGEWSVRLVFHTELGVLKVIGGVPKDFSYGDSPYPMVPPVETVFLGFDPPLTPIRVFGISSTGAVFYLDRMPVENASE